MSTSALSGIRVADFTWAWAGSYSMMLLAILGAQVIKIESRQRVDNARHQFSLSLPANAEIDEGHVFHQLNVNKLSVSLNLTHPRARELAKKIISVSDIVAENMRPGAMERLGLGYSELVKINPDIIMLSSSARGGTGPECNYAGYAPNQSAVAGWSHLTGYADGEPTTLHATPDLTNATMTAFYVLSALHHRFKTGQGQHIDASQVEILACSIGDVVMEYTMNGNVPSRDGNRDQKMSPHNCYRCQGDDKWVSIAVSADEEWQALCHALDNPDWSRDERFADAYSRWQNRDELDKLVQAWTIEHRHYELMESLQRIGVAAIPSFSSDELLSDPHLNERGFFQELMHPVVGKVTVLGPPWKLSETPAQIVRHAPLLGQDSNYILGEILGMPRNEIGYLVEERVIY